MLMMKPPPIQLTCDCGAVGSVPFGERWTCPDCGRSWNTATIPADEYQGVLREMRRLRLLVMGLSVGVAVLFALLALFVNTALFFVFPVFLLAWMTLYLPWYRRRVRRVLASLPRWELSPE
jgi:hypothetical protein